MKEEVKSTSSVASNGKKPKHNLTYLRDKHREMVKGLFRYFEVPGGMMRFVFKEFKGDPILRYEFYDNQVYTIPLGVAKHINNNMWYPVHNYVDGLDGKPVARINEKIHRAGFQSLEFMDVEGLEANPSPIVTVERI